MKVITESELLDRIRAFLDRHSMAPTTFGRQATGEPQLISSIESGRSPSLKVVSRIAAFMEERDLEAHFGSPPPPPEGGDAELPFATAPVNPTGASSPTSSPTSAQPQPPAASDTCPTASCSDPEAEPSVAAPTNQPRAAAA